MDYDKTIERLRTFKIKTRDAEWTPIVCLDAATNIETLLAENKRLRADWEKYQPCEHWETLNEAVEILRADLARVTVERNAAVKKYEAEKEDFLDYALSGTNNAAPYCTNRHPDCVDKRGWCIPVKCHGFSRDKED